MATVLLVMCCVLAALVIRLVDVQGLQASRYAAYGLSERLHAVTLAPVRGQIVDRSGDVLAMSVSLTTVYADPGLVTDPASEARQLAPILGLDPGVLQQKLSAPNRFEYLAHTVPDDVANRVKALKLPGIAYLSEPKRYLPDGDLAASVLGQVGYDGHGLSGVEYQYDSRLAGKPGRLLVQEGAGGQAIPGTPEERDPAVPGQSLQLTIDRSLQYEAEQALIKQVTASHAKGGTAVVMDSKTGEILALANVVAPSDPTKPVGSAPTDLAATEVYEPGSVMKAVTLSAALQEGVVQPDTRFTVPDSTVFHGSVIHDAEGHPTEDWSVPDILSYSSNVGTLQISQRLGAERIFRYQKAFGLGAPTGLGVPGESAGLMLPPSKWSGTSIATIPIGQGIAVTPLQMLDVYNTIANGGVFVPPRLIKGWVGPDGSVQAAAGRPGHRVVSARTARQMTAMLEDVVRDGTGQAAAIPGYDVAGKTGTSQKPATGRAGYEPGAYMATFAGFVPAENPQITAMVVLDQPTPVFYGGLVAAPVFSDIAQYALRIMRIPPPRPVNLGPDVPAVDPSAAAGGDGPLPTPQPAAAPQTAAGQATTAPTAAPVRPSSSATPSRTATSTTVATTRQTDPAPGGSRPPPTTLPPTTPSPKKP
ncbi:MAG TPA: penicillin-binding protein 2 [Acidimicrobiales bacterium]|nr:penicillin-binding protein 2 [Acidimicrobiales bacterium]